MSFPCGGSELTLAKPLAIVSMTRLNWSKGLSSLSLEKLWLLYLLDRPACSLSFPWLDSSLFLPSGLYNYGLWKNFFRWSSLVISSILSFKALHLSLSLLADKTSSHTWFRYLVNSSIYIYLVSLVHSSSSLDAGFLCRLLTKGDRRNAIIKWCIATVGSKF